MRFLLALATSLLPLLAFSSECGRTQGIPPANLSAPAGISSLVFFARDLASGDCWASDPAQTKERHAPWSSFKIPHFLIALETGAVASPDALLPWDAQRRPAASYWPKAWRQDHSLGTAFADSAAWLFQDLVERIGGHAYEHWLERFRYGNRRVPAGRDDFWLGGPLTISPEEQVAFLACVAQSGCGARRASVLALEKVALQAERNGWRMYAKTGSGPARPGDFDGPFEGWYVGYIRDPQGQPHTAFATYVRAENFAALKTFRQEVSVRILAELKRWPD